MKHLDNLYMIFACGAGIALQLLVTEIPYFVKLFGTVRLTFEEWGMLFLLSCVPLVVHELLVLSNFLTEKAEEKGLQETEKCQQHKDGSAQPGEAA